MSINVTLRRLVIKILLIVKLDTPSEYKIKVIYKHDYN